MIRKLLLNVDSCPVDKLCTGLLKFETVIDTDTNCAFNIVVLKNEIETKTKTKTKQSSFLRKSCRPKIFVTA